MALNQLDDHQQTWRFKALKPLSLLSVSVSKKENQTPGVKQVEQELKLADRCQNRAVQSILFTFSPKNFIPWLFGLYAVQHFIDFY